MSHFDFLIFLFFTHYCTKTAYIRACFFCLFFFFNGDVSPHLVPWTVFYLPQYGQDKAEGRCGSF